jgi:hypothetical protein
MMGKSVVHNRERVRLLGLETNESLNEGREDGDKDDLDGLKNKR